jgi:hypothetical protein
MATIQGMGPLSDGGAKALESTIGMLPSNQRREHKELSAADAQAPYQRWTLLKSLPTDRKAKTAKNVVCANCVSLLWPRKRFPHFFRQQGLVDQGIPSTRNRQFAKKLDLVTCLVTDAPYLMIIEFGPNDFAFAHS